jgi:uncharacterized protein
MAQTAEPLTIVPLPMPLRWVAPPVDWSAGNRMLTIQAGALTDLFVDPATGAATLTAPCLVGEPEADFVMSARVSVGSATDQ